ncbi:hypothetical protein C0585_06630 [Candidatus Woesearchaeota archaeon]|nr:MAG: hypothetical protein C0585_06630 [Candidatus Woesearchaeota archaeon]
MNATILRNENKQYFYLATILLTPLSFLFDGVVSELMLKTHNSLFDIIFSFFSNISIIVGFILVVTISMLAIKKDHKWSIAILTSLILTLLVVYYFKFLVMRPRPNGIELVIFFNLIDYSFPSLHTAIIFAMIPILDNTFSHHKRLWIFIGVMVGLSRLYLGVHYFSDVIYGVLIGLVIGEGILLLEKRYGWFKYLEKYIWK